MDIYSGDDLLKLFDALHINLGHLNPNVIRGWFDIDDIEVQRVLKFICSSITEENYISPIQQAEYEALEQVLDDKELTKAIEELELEYPGLFESELNNLEISILEDQLELMHERKCDEEQQLQFNERLSDKLSIQHSKILNDESECEQKFSEVYATCCELSTQLEQANDTLYEELKNISVHMEFLNNLFPDGSDEEFKTVTLQITPTLKQDRSLEKSCNIKDNLLADIKGRLLHSKMKCISYEMECEQLTAQMNRLHKLGNALSPSAMLDSSILEGKIAMKTAQLKSLLEILENCMINSMEYLAGKCQIDYAQKELNLAKKKLNSLNQIEEELMQLFCYYGVILCLYSQENLNQKEFFQNMHSYTVNMKTCNMRIESMLNVIDEYENFKTLPLEKQSKLISSLQNLFHNRMNSSLEDTLKYLLARNEEIASIENRCFENFQTNFPRFIQSYSNLKQLETFLKSGPTCHFIMIPPSLEKMLSQAGDILRNQDISVKSAMQISFKSKDLRKENKWQRYKSLLWVYFLTDGAQLQSILEQMEQDGKSGHQNKFSV